mgnify:CR=1 FL=1
MRPLAYGNDVMERRARGERVGLLVVAVHDWDAGQWYAGRPEVCRVVLPSDLPIEAADWTIASRNGRPASYCWRMKSTSRIELRTMMPARAIMPIIDVAVYWLPSSACPGMTPTMVSGIGAMMINGSR